MKIKIIPLAALSLLALVSFSALSAEPPSSDEIAVKKAADQFYHALNTLFEGEVGEMKDVWSHADDVTYMGPVGGFRVGWKQVSVDWEAQAANKLGGHVEATEMQLTVGRDLALVHNYEKGENKGPNGESQTVLIRATNVFRKENGAWKMIGHHTDLLPFLAK